MQVVAVVAVGAGPGIDVRTPLHGEPIVVRSVRAVLAAAPALIVVLVPPELVASVERACAAAVHAHVVVRPHAGQRAGTALGDDQLTLVSADVAVVHDASRPLAPPELTRAVVAAVRSGHAAAVPVLPLVDTVKLVDGEARVHATPDRATLRVVQTPQAFRADLLARVLPAAALDPTHGWAGAGGSVQTVGGHPLAFPVRTPWDLEMAELMGGGDR